MKEVKALYELLHCKKSFIEKYPMDPRDGKLHVLYVSPLLNGTGYYRMLAPMMELNKTKTHAALASSLHKWNFTKEFNDYDNPVDRRLIEWADFVVFPTILSDATYIVHSFKKIKPELQLVMDLDCYYLLP